MSTTPDSTARPSAFGRYFFIFLFGLVLGGVGMVMLLNALNARKDHFPDSVMEVMKWHSGKLEQTAKENRCAATDTLPHLKALGTMANDLERAFPDDAEDKRFVEHASAFRATIDGGLSNPPLTCDGVNALTAKIGEGCKACHQDFRN